MVQMQQDLVALSESKFLRRYSREELANFASELGADVTEEMTKTEMYAALVVAQAELDADDSPTVEGAQEDNWEHIDTTPEDVKQAVAAELDAAATVGTGGKRNMRGRSTIEEPVNRVWHIADKLFAQARAKGEAPPRRKDVVEYCHQHGIALYTARTQYQLWFTHTNRGTKLMADGNPIVKKARKATVAVD
jgi:hypothetical protein